MSILDRINRKIDNMGTVMTRFGIDPAIFAQPQESSAFVAALRACQACQSGDICRAWLDSAPERIDRIPEFCPNALRFERAKETMRGRTLN